jgi:signal transduction histidine kinase
VAEQFNSMATRLDELVQAQSRFVADASHQLRSPLTALRLRLENLEASSDPDAAADIAAAGAEVLRLSRIVDGLLTLGRAGQEQPRAGMVDIAEVMRQRCDAWSALAEERGVALEDSGLGSGAVVTRLIEGDLDQILDNLIANALEVSPPGGRLRVALELADAGHADLHVMDEGPGMEEEERKRAFDRFWQGVSSSGHSGLGLSIVRQLAQRNGAEVELRPTEPHGMDAVVHLNGVSSGSAGRLSPAGSGSPGR